MNSQLVRQQLNIMGTGAQVVHIYPEDIKRINIPIYDFDIQKQIGSRLNNIEKIINQVISKINSSKSLQKSLINQVF